MLIAGAIFWVTGGLFIALGVGAHLDSDAMSLGTFGAFLALMGMFVGLEALFGPPKKESESDE